MFYVLLYATFHYSIAIILMWKRELIALLNLSSSCLVMVERLFLAVPWGCLRFVIVLFPDHTHLLFLGPSQGFPGTRLMGTEEQMQIFERNKGIIMEQGR